MDHTIPGEMMSRLIRIFIVSLSLAALSCQEQPTQTTSAEPGPAPIVAENYPAPTTDTQPANTPYVEPLPTSEVPSILRRDQTTTATQIESNVVTDTWPPRVNSAELKQMLDQNKAVVVDVRAPQYFQERRIPGSLNLPLSDVVVRANELPEGKTVVTVCT